MTDRQPPRPTDAELAILGVLWERGPSTVRDVHEQLNKDGSTGYTTILKLLQIMTEKGLVVRDESEPRLRIALRRTEDAAPVACRPGRARLWRLGYEAGHAGSVRKKIKCRRAERHPRAARHS